ncbi:RNA polymerase II subunit A C-terminal domain phosphatase ssu72 [Penicillium macrosclerotiorum]|uniref:RNA polymerase II subunit A C-terminal domain phosphatase ssu72 n=1 Tax=Penicillium macrosclerotiorum TaxID=303699 RepID=UPI0025487C74|nr:RNA polymerase II subunit A C-terminal domain phosphatase ssu72 [Penicillium macrosclerotiorum]KAJ5693145.1 RNA polymerase II subunit A C-terminal domain phosphatase ssu72 [Penicillium macrosclerotiorum]
MAYDPRRVNTGSTTPQNPPPPPPPPPESTGMPPLTVAAGAAAATATTLAEPPADAWKLKFCTVCASNNNRSMEAHLRLSTAPTAFPVISFGTGSLVRLPGPSITQPNVYSFNTTSYNQMYEELQDKDERLYRSNGILNMLDRNRNLKWGPERFQDWVPGLPRLDHVSKGDKGAIGAEAGVVDVIITCEERCWDAVVDDLMNKGNTLNRPVHVFNIDIKDNHEEALLGGKAILDLANRLNDAALAQRKRHGLEGWENGTGAARLSFDESVPEILAEWQEKNPNLPALWTLAWL